MIRRPYRTVVSNPRNRNLILACLICLTLFYLLPFDDGPALESAALEKYMNSGSSLSQPLKVVKSSVDWGKVEYRYPPEAITPVPKGRARKLPRIQYPFPTESASEAQIRQDRRRAVLERTRKDWNSYRKYAWKRDALLPLSAKGRDQFSGWAATLVDSLDTLWIMGLKEEFDEAVAAVAEIDFGRSTTGSVNIFETTIRYLGGLLAAYDLSKRPVLLEKAIELGDLIYGGFNTEHRMPVDMLDFEAAKRGTGLNVEYQVVSASPGTLTMEMTRLSQITGDSKYYDAISRVVDLFYEGQNKTSLPGMFPMYVSMKNRDVTTGAVFTLAGCADSLYEYFPKMHALLGGLEAKYETLTRGFLKPAKEHLFFRPMLPDNADILISGNVNILADGEPSLDPESEHLACFIGGTFALAGRLLNSEEDVEIGARLARGCAYAYKAFPTGMMPERFNMVICEDKKNCKWDEKKWVEGRAKRPEWKEHLPKGFTTAKDPRYILRPEAIESVFYLWRITGQKEWQDYAWDMFQAVANGTETQYASAAVLDVTIAKKDLPQEDYMESFWIAETLKYFYLAFSPPDLIDLDKYVLNTEAHPFLRHT
ncbi:family 47 glycosyl hydrolase [Coniochaeta sp. PMI_546]|nr:family 47 glycosyl hydrolase [Coniochaeta sp. PMI_546]